MDSNGGPPIDLKSNTEPTIIDDTVSRDINSASETTTEDQHGPNASNIETKNTGCTACHPKWLNVFLKPKLFIATLCCFSFIQGYVINGLNNANTTTYEKRFFLSSSEVGAISSTYDFVGGLLAIPISYFGAHAHKPRLLAVMSLVFGLGSCVMLLPHVISDVYDYGQGTTNICNIQGNVTSCVDSTDASLPGYLYLLCLGMALHGIAGTTLYTIGAATIDECVTRQSASFALSLMFAMGSLGPALGFILGGQFLKIYVDVDVLGSDSAQLDELDPRWVGAWWIGFTISVVLSSLLALVMSLFPRHIPVSDEILKSRIDQSQEGLAEEVTKPDFGSIWDFPRATLNLLKNMPFMFTTFAGISDGFIVIAFATFLPKIIEQQFNKSVSFSNLVFGAIVVVGGVGGQLVGGYVCKRAKLKVRGMLIWSASCAILTAVLTSMLWLHCDDPPIAGVNRAFGNTSSTLSTLNTEAACNSRCQCSLRVHEPVCGEDNLEYLTPCHAGCRSEEIIDKEKFYFNCSCVELTLGGQSGSGTAVAGRCNNGSCIEFYIAMVLLFFVVFTLLLDWGPRATITLRCVPESQRTYSLGLQALFVRLLGTVPAPIVFGAVLDIACKHHRISCDGAEVCSIYDRYLLSRNTFLLAFFFKLLTCVLYTTALLLYKPPQSLPDSSNNTRDRPCDEGISMEIDVSPDSTMDGVVNKAYDGGSELLPEQVEDMDIHKNSTDI